MFVVGWDVFCGVSVYWSGWYLFGGEVVCVGDE